MEEKGSEPGSEKILVVDDDIGALTLCKLMLEEEGYEVETLTNGNKVLDVIRRGGVSLIVLDVLMVSGDGRLLLGKIREINATVPVIFYSGYACDEERLSVYGVPEGTPYFIKGRDDEKLLETIRECTNKC